MIIFVDSRSHPQNAHKHSKNTKTKCKGKVKKLVDRGDDNMVDDGEAQVNHVDDTFLPHSDSSSCFPFAVNCRFSKTFFGIPRKCSLCHKIIVLNAGYACQFCRSRCHKKCLSAMRLRLRACSLSRLPPGDNPLLNKILLDGDINSNPIVYDNWADLLSHVNSVNESSPRVRVNSARCLSAAKEASLPQSSLSSPRLVTDRCESASSSSTETLTSSLPRSPITLDIYPPDDEEPAAQSGMVDRFLQLLWWRNPTTKVDECNNVPSRPESLMGGSSRSSAASPVRTPVDEFNYNLLEELFQQRSSASSTASGAACSPSTTTDMDRRPNGTLNRRLTWLRHFIGERPTQSQDCVTMTPPIPIERMQQVDEEPPLLRLSSSWPIAGFHMNHEDTIIEEEYEYDEDDDLASRRNTVTSCASGGKDRKSTDVTEWSIPFEDLVFGDCIAQGRLFHTYNGKWHGEATIHKYMDDDDKGFVKEVQRLARIRHENITLFMGACIQTPLLAVIMSCQKGNSLQSMIHENKSKLSHEYKVVIAKQIAQGMGYLHAKGVVMKCLSSRSVFVENKVKLSMVDYGGPTVHYPCKSAVVLKHHLTYCSPELITNMTVQPPTINFNTDHTKMSDLYAFGTVLYEILSGSYPYIELQPECVIYQIGHGNHQHLHDLACHTALKGLVEGLWSVNPCSRPTFTTILLQLQQTAALHKKHSSSEPRLNQAGFHNCFPF